MGRPVYLPLFRALFPFLPLTACLLWAGGCNNTCVSGTLNPGGSTVTVKTSSPPPSCTLTTANGVVELEIGAAAAAGPTSMPGAIGPHFTHLFVTLAGVDAHASAFADDDSSGWQPLALAPHQAYPLQVDLLADPRASTSSTPFPDAVLPAGVYRQIRLRLAASLPGEPVLEANPCGPGTPHCAVASDGRVRPLAFPPSRPDLRIVLDGTPGHELYIPPDGTVALVIELDRDRSFLWPSGDSVLLAPVFHLSVQRPPNISEN